MNITTGIYPTVTGNTSSGSSSDYYTVTYPSVGTGTYQINYPNVQPATWISTTTGNGIGGSNGLKVHGDAEFEGDIKVKGRSLVDMLEGIEKRLGILTANPGLEERWEKLKALGMH